MLSKIATISCPKDSIGEQPKKGKELGYSVRPGKIKKQADFVVSLSILCYYWTEVSWFVSVFDN